MSKTGFSSKDIIDIISALKGSGVSRVKYGTLEIDVLHLDSWGEPVNQTVDPATPAVEVPRSTPLPRIQELHKVLEEDQLEQLKLEDPVAYERMIEAKEIVDGDTNTE